MDDLIVIILTLVIAGAGVIGQLKKKKLPAATPQNQGKPENIWDLFAEEEEIIPVYNPQQPFYQTKTEEAEPYENEQGYEFKPVNEGGTLVKKEIMVQPERKVLVNKRKSKFPLREAVIYSTILNRKYF